MYLEKIQNERDLKKLNIEELPLLAKEIRSILIEKASTVGGHLAPNLGVVELTIALHYVFDSPKDKIVFDVSHQSYTHKILTGRKNSFVDHNDYSLVTGYTNPAESIHDLFNIGHTSTSISLACGMAKARDLLGTDENVIAIIGDASLDGGQSFEALNYIGEAKSGLIIIVNDNNMSIAENHGALNIHFNNLKEKNGEGDVNYFKSLGLDYYFIQDGHNITDIISTLKSVKGTKRPVVVHCVTQKGKGYVFAEENREKWHYTRPFKIENGEPKVINGSLHENYGSIVGDYLINKIQNDRKLIAITAALPACFGFNAQRRKIAGDQFIDVGIAEQNMVAIATGLAKSGCKPVTITESSFYQRAYDQIEQEMCINKCAVTMLVAFSGIYAHDDDTHAGLFDIVLLGNIPGLVYLAPSNKQEYLNMLEWSIEQNSTPVAIRIPWNGVHYTDNEVPTDYSCTKYCVKEYGKEVAIIGLGSFFQLGQEISETINTELGIKATLIDPMFVSGLDNKTLDELKNNHKLVVTLEDGIVSGGFGSKIAQYYGPTEMKVLTCGFSMEIPTKFTREEMMKKNGLTPEQVTNKVKEILFNT